MAFRRRRRIFKRRRIFRRRSSRRTRRSFKKLKRAVRRIQSTIETKFKAYSQHTVIGNNLAGSVIYDILGASGLALAQGVGTNQRVGQRIRATSIDLKINLRSAVVSFTIAQAAAPEVRLFLIKDMQTILGTTPTYADIFELNALTSDRSTYDYQNWTNRKRFKILWTKVIKIQTDYFGWNDTSAIPEGTATFRRIQLHLKLKNHKVEYAGSTTEVARGKIYFIAVSNYDATVSSRPDMYFFGRVKYQDA